MGASYEIWRSLLYSRRELRGGRDDKACILSIDSCIFGPLAFIIKFRVHHLQNPKLFPNLTVNKILVISLWVCLGTTLGLA